MTLTCRRRSTDFPTIYTPHENLDGLACAPDPPGYTVGTAKAMGFCSQALPLPLANSSSPTDRQGSGLKSPTCRTPNRNRTRHGRWCDSDVQTNNLWLTLPRPGMWHYSKCLFQRSVDRVGFKVFVPFVMLQYSLETILTNNREGTSSTSFEGREM